MLIRTTNHCYVYYLQHKIKMIKGTVMCLKSSHFDSMESFEQFVSRHKLKQKTLFTLYKHHKYNPSGHFQTL